MLVPGAAGGVDKVVTWSAWEEGKSDVRKGVFYVDNAACAYTSMVDPDIMPRVLPNLEKITVHRADASFQDMTFEERFFLVGASVSRYHRTIDGSSTLSWKLISGRQAKHDGNWSVSPDGRVSFQNAIQAKSMLHRALLRGIQVRAMEGVASSIQEHCKL